MKTSILSKSSTRESKNWKSRHTFPILISLLFLPASLFSKETKKIAPVPDLVLTDSSQAPSEDSPEQVGNMESAGNPAKNTPDLGVKTGRKGGRKQKNSPSLSLNQIQKKKEILEKILKFGSNRERKEAMRELLHFPKEHSQELYQLVSEILANDTDLGIRIVCLRTLGEIGYTKEPPVIINLLSEKSDDIKEAAVFAIQKLKLDEASPEIVKLLKEQDFSKNMTLVNNSVTALGELQSGKVGGDFLESKFRDKTTHANVRSNIALYFSKTKDTRAEAALIDAASDEGEDQTTRAYAVNALGKMNSHKSIPAIREILSKINDAKGKFEVKKLAHLKIYCISALVALGDSEVMKELVSYAKDDDPNIRIRAIKQLAEFDTKEMREMLEYKAQRDPSKKVQETAKKLLEELRKKEADSEGSKAINPETPAKK